MCEPVVYKIPYRRAPRLAYLAWPLGRVRRASKGILHTSEPVDPNYFLAFNLSCRVNSGGLRPSGVVTAPDALANAMIYLYILLNLSFTFSGYRKHRRRTRAKCDEVFIIYITVHR